ncbi:MAG: hypothetical protein U0790_26405 [Isosphaeraceae bacterium]
MLKPLTLSLSLAVALGFCSVSMAGGHDGCTNCGLASPQGGPIASAQGPIATGCDAPVGCGSHKLHDLFSGLGGHLDGLHCKLKGMLHPPVTYEWVLKKKRLWGHKGCGGGGCDTCGGAAPAAVYPTGQVAPSGQGGYAAPSGQGGYGAPSGQGGFAAPQAAPVYGVGQHAYRAAKPAATIASVPAEMTPAIAGEEVPPAPEVKQSTQSGLLLPTPAGN